VISDIEYRKRSERQMNKIRAAVAGNWPALIVVFDAAPVTGTLRFRVETVDHVPVIESSGNLAFDELEKWTDEELPDVPASLSGGRLKVS
jgi:hypothetical protein